VRRVAELESFGGMKPPTLYRVLGVALIAAPYIDFAKGRRVPIGCVAFTIICLIAVLYYVGKHRDILPVDFSSAKDPKSIKALSIFCAFLVLHGVVLSFFQFPK
jgi:hypothetical protein